VIDSKNIHAYILAGGQSSRMGTDKGLLTLHGLPMIEHILRQLAPLFQNIHVISHVSAYGKFGYPIMPDLVAGKGPLGGIATALAHTTSQYNFILSCDMPMIQSKAIAYFLQNCAPTQVNMAKENGRNHPLFALYDKSCLPIILERIEQNKLKLLDTLALLQPHVVPMNDWYTCFKNINTPKDYEDLTNEN